MLTVNRIMAKKNPSGRKCFSYSSQLMPSGRVKEPSTLPSSQPGVVTHCIIAAFACLLL